MYKHYLSLFLLLTLAYAYCPTPYAAKFYGEHVIPAEPKDPEVILLETSEPLNNVEYALAMQLCPKNLKKTTEKIVKLAIAKKLALKASAQVLGIILPIVGDFFQDFLSPEAMSYGSTRKAMEALIANAFPSNVSCENIEKASTIYYHYSFIDYEKEICSGGSSLKKVYSILYGSETKSSRGISAVPRVNTHRSGRVIKKVPGKDIPLCHPCMEELVRKAEQLPANYSSLLLSAVENVSRSCPVKFRVGSKEAVLWNITGNTYYFRYGGKEKPLLVVKRSGDKITVENIGGEHISGYLPLEEGDVPLSLSPGEKEEIDLGKSDGRSWVYRAGLPLLLFSVSAVILWRWMDERKEGAD